MGKQSQHPAVNKSATQRVVDEMNRQGITFEDLAKRLGVVVGTAENLVYGTNRGESTRRKIEDILGMRVWSTPEDFATRQSGSKLREALRSLADRTVGQMAAIDNSNPDYQAILGNLGINLVALVLDGAPENPFWKGTDTAEPFIAELTSAQAGEFDSARMFQGCYICYYYAGKTQFAKTLYVFKEGLKTRGLLDHAHLFYVECESGAWVTVWPATAQRIIP